MVRRAVRLPGLEGDTGKASPFTSTVTFSALPNSTANGALPDSSTLRPALPMSKNRRLPRASLISVQQSPEKLRRNRVSPSATAAGAGSGSLMAGALLGSVPVAVVYSFFVEYYVSGMTGAVKG